MLETLHARRFPVDELLAVASPRSAGTQVRFGDRAITVQAIDDQLFDGVDLALFSAGGATSTQWAPRVAARGCLVIDNSSAWRMDPDVPLVVPEVNGATALEANAKKRIIGNPNCSTIQMVVALQPLHQAAGLRRVVVTTFQSVSGGGAKAMAELDRQVRAHLDGKPLDGDIFAHPIAFNVLPHIDSFLPSGYTKEEQKMIAETRKIMGLPTLNITATCVRVPVFIGHSESVNVQTERPLGAQRARELLRQAPGVEVIDDPANKRYPLPRDVAGTDATFVGRIRDDESAENALNLWVVADNLRKGAALNAVQIAEYLVERGGV
jgi:aspartate-semialdehyde dehydrogenase